MSTAVKGTAVPIQTYPAVVVTPANAQAIIAAAVTAHQTPVVHYIQQQQAPFVLFGAFLTQQGNAGDYIAINSVTGAMFIILAADFAANWTTP